MTKTINIGFTVDKIKYRDDDTGFTIFKATFTKYVAFDIPTTDIVIKGTFQSIFEGDEFDGEGFWRKEKRFGYAFQLTDMKRTLPQTKKGMIRFIHRAVRGVGYQTATDIVDMFGLDSLRVIEDDWRALLKVNKIAEKRAKRIHQVIVSHKAFESIAIYIVSHGGTYKQALMIYETFGKDAILVIKDNPYVLKQIKGLSFKDIDQFAYKEGIRYDQPERVNEAILYFLEKDTEHKGNLYTTRTYIVEALPSFLSKEGAYPDTKQLTTETIIDGLSRLIKQDSLRVDTFDDEAIYLKKYQIVEFQVVKYLKALIEVDKQSLATVGEIETFLKRYQEERAITLASKQRDAVFMALRHGISILTGGPGTGKTQTINTILQCLFSLNPSATIHLVAPTGKASKRMNELTGIEAMTIHRKIKLYQGQEDKASDVLVEGDILIVDESSMVDAFVFYRLLKALDKGVRLLLVGDYEQLPSVGPGLILRDLIHSGRIPVTKLDEIFRQAQESQIVMNSHALIQGTPVSGLLHDESKGDFYFIPSTDKEHSQSVILKSIDKFITHYNYRFKDIQVLTPMRKGDLGFYQLNHLIQKRFNPASPVKQEFILDGIYVLREGDRVMQTENNPQLNVFNGEVGEIYDIQKDNEGQWEIEVHFDDREVYYDEASVYELELAYAITIHKSQGSEFPVVIMPIHSSQQHMLNRNLIYTGWTRAKERLVNIGEWSALDGAIARTDQTLRLSKIQDKIKHQLQTITHE